MDRQDCGIAVAPIAVAGVMWVGAGAQAISCTRSLRSAQPTPALTPAPITVTESAPGFPLSPPRTYSAHTPQSAQPPPSPRGSPSPPSPRAVSALHLSWKSTENRFTCPPPTTRDSASGKQTQHRSPPHTQSRSSPPDRPPRAPPPAASAPALLDRHPQRQLGIELLPVLFHQARHLDSDHPSIACTSRISPAYSTASRADRRAPSTDATPAPPTICAARSSTIKAMAATESTVE